MEVIQESDERLLRITRTLDPPGLRLEGEFDAIRQDEVTQELSSLAAEHSEVRLDLAGLDFLGLGALRSLTTFANSRDDEVRIVLDNLAPSVEKLIATVGWERLPGLVQGRKGDS